MGRRTKAMKICVTSQGNNLDSLVDPRFGRCQYFIIVDTDTMEYKAIENSNIAAGGGAGIQSAQLIANEGVKTVLTGNCGPNAFRVFSGAGIQIMTGVSGVVREAIEKFKRGEFKDVSGPTVGSHFGLGGFKEKSFGAGGMKKRNVAPPISNVPNKEIEKGEDLEAIRKQANVLKEQLDQLLGKIKEIEDE